MAKVSIPFSVTNIGEGVFSYCGSLSNITIPNSVMSIGKEAFRNCCNLSNVTIPKSVTTMWYNAFFDCGLLRSITLGDGLETIGIGAFSGCVSLERFSFGTNLKLISKDAFSRCKAMKKIVANASVPPTCSNGALDDIDKETCILQVSTENIDVYKTSTPWNEFFKISSIETGIEGTAFDALRKRNVSPLVEQSLILPKRGSTLFV